jgi:3-carboxy-cis,cis-muconate cycloisomerase
MTVNPVDSEVFGDLFGTGEMRALFGDRQRFQAMLEVEAALARAEARLGIIPAGAAAAITRAARVEMLDFAALGESTRLVGLPVVALVKALERAAGEDGAGYVHWGATTQDVMDTALVLQIRHALALVEAGLLDLARALGARAEAHRGTVMAGRTYLQYALPITFGYKCAVWLAPVLDHVERLRQLRPRVEMLQFGGAVGTLAALQERGLDVASRVAALLDLQLPEAPWHSHRDRIAEVAAALSILTGTCGKIARDISLLMQTDVGEASEARAPGRGGPAMIPDERNPTGVATALAAATIAPNLTATILAAQVQEHERALGGWQAEWQTFPALCLVTSGALHAIVEIAEGVEIDSERMRNNLAATRGQIMTEAVHFALAGKLGRPEAHRIVEEAIRKASSSKRDLQDVLGEDDRVKRCLSIGELARLFEPMAYQGVAQTFIERIVVSLQGRSAKR